MLPSTRRERYLQQDTPTRLGGLAADLARVVTAAKVPALAVIDLLEESRAFVEWSAPDLLPDRVNDAARLVEAQRLLTHWYWNWDKLQNDPAQRAKLAEQAQQWSYEVLKMSGLLDQE